MSLPASPNGPSLLIKTQQPKNAWIQAENISKEFFSDGKALRVLDAISLEVKSGQMISIVGKSGSGKSTLLNILSGLDQPSGGKTSVNGSLSYVPQKDLLLPWRTIIENILLPVEIQKGDIKTSAEKARDLMQKNGILPFKHMYPAEISGGMRQKVSLIRALLQDSDIVLFDEPFSAIDFDARLQLGKEIRSYIISSQKAAIFVTHNIEEAIAVSDQLYVLSPRPAKILHHAHIDIPESYRDPVNVRKSKNFQELFEHIWKMMA
ncbi:MAG: ABC transporter ATP-binding protein [Verrucomicrobiota bacterium]